VIAQCSQIRWVPHGYALVRVDSRGSGCSEGFLDPFSARQIPDIYRYGLHDVPQNRPPEVFGGKVTIHASGAHPSHLLPPIVPGT
jgi:X-Pro dipeptidyl-peptidase (S15 family)